MKLIFLGTGSAFTKNNFQSNMLLEADNNKLLIDCGSDIRFSLSDVGLDYKDISNVYVSHQHADHAGGLEYIAFCSYFDPTVPRPVLYIDERLATQLWENTLQGGLGSVQNKITKLSDFFHVKAIKKNGIFPFCKKTFRLVQTVHVMNGYTIVPSYGLIWKAERKKVFLTTDTQFCPNQIQDFYNDADIIFHDCETAPYKSGVHAHYTELKTLNAKTKKKMWLYHYQDGELPDAKKDGFAGFIQQKQVFII